MNAHRALAAALIAALIIVQLSATSSAAKTIQAKSCSLADVQTAVDSAHSGDTVDVPVGSATWNSNLTLTKGLMLRGAGIGNTIIISGYEPSRPGNTLAESNLRCVGLSRTFRRAFPSLTPYWYYGSR